MNSLQRQASDYGYAFAVTLAAVVAIVALPDTRPSTDLVFAPLALALFAGFLLTVRLAPGRPSAALVLLPAMAVDARLGLAALLAVGYAAIVVNLVRGLRGPRVLSTAGHAILAFAGAHLCAQLTPQIASGALRAVLQMGPTRLPGLPTVPTVAEGGYPGAQAIAWWGLFAPGGTPKPIIERFRTAFVDSLREERVARQLTETQQMSLVLSGPEKLREFSGEQARIWGAVVRDNSIRSDE